MFFGPITFMIAVGAAQIFAKPLYVPTSARSLLWALPVCVGIAVVYKAVKLDDLRPARFVREVMLLAMTIIGVLIFAALTLLVIAILARHLPTL